MNEAFVSCQSVYALWPAETPRRSGPVDMETVRKIVGEQTGLPMERYDLEPTPNMYGWVLVRR